ncbi:endonuclease Q family protein [Bacillus sp. B1-b2]|uniref:endonuclease Q family protein n=1 Tax=Bacillus sp. B1-b2 TaxID=2653201 RepID=UPI001261F80E|nr:endonuclease Q family protein [Bacillus sp. B1-b2]KAB7672868.1 TIGR00375 family protein [Bacillus sp. B1-b2]
MNHYFADLHIHIGRTISGKPVKITASKSLTLTAIIEFASKQKGLDIIGIIDCQSPEVLKEMEDLIHEGRMVEMSNGGMRMNDITILLGSELEIYDETCKGPIHVLCYMPTLEAMNHFSIWLSDFMKNITLSSQRIYVSGRELQEKVVELHGIFIPAHVFTPFKSLYGSGVRESLTEVFDYHKIDGIELGLSANTQMADQIKELHAFTFLTNSDAHSLEKIAREYQVMKLEEASFLEWKKALHQEEGRAIVANYGLDPKLGKYHETVCLACYAPHSTLLNNCVNCGSKKWVKGVAARILELKDNEDSPIRPPYIHQIPLEYIPGLGKKTLEKLLLYFSTEMQIIHEAPYSLLIDIVPKKVVEYIMAARTGEIVLQTGGGGKYGRVEGERKE